MAIPVPKYIQRAARKGLSYVGQGLGGRGLRDETIREARRLARGRITLDKAKRMRAWLARHDVDLDAPRNDPNHPDYPGPGAVARLLWGSDPRDPDRTVNWLNRVLRER